MDSIDCRGKPCPIPVIELSKAVRLASTGSHVELWATDSAARADVKAFCEATGHQLLSTDVEEDVLKFTIRIGP